MKKINLLKWGFLCLFSLLTTMVGATTYTCTFGSGTTVSGDGRNSFDTDNGEFFVFTRKSSTDSDTGETTYTSNTSDATKWGSVTYNGETYTYGFKMEGDSEIAFTTTEKMVLTVIVGTGTSENNELSFETKGESYTETGTPVYDSDGTTVLYYEFTKTLDAGSHAIYIGYEGTSSKQSAIFYISVTSVDEEGGDTETTYSEANWDWENTNPANIQDFDAIQYGNTGKIESDVEGLYLYVATETDNGKVGPYADANCAQFSAGAILRVPVINEGDVVTFKGWSGLTFTIGGGSEQTATGSAVTYTATSTDVANGYVEIVSTGGTQYMYSVKVDYTTALTSDDIASIDYNKIAAGNTEDEQGETGDITVTLVSPTQDEFTANGLDNNTDITFSIENLPEGYGVYFAIYDSDDEIVDGGMCEEDTDNPGNYTYTWDYFFGLSADATYTGKVTIYSTSYKDDDYQVGDPYQLFTTVGAVATSDVTLESVSPDPDTTETLETNEITLKFSGKVTITNAYVISYIENEGRYQVNVTPDDGVASETWTITVPEATMETLTDLADEGIGFTMIVSAQDEDEVALDDITISYDAVSYTSESGSEEDDDTWTFDPADGSTVESLSTITISCTNGIKYWGSEGDITITDSDDQPVSCTITSSLTEDDDAAQTCTLTITPAITDPGIYTVTIAKETFGVGSDLDDNEATTLTYTIESSGNEEGNGGETALELTFDPESGSTISGSLSSIKVSCAEEYYLASSGNDITIYKDGDEVTDVTAKADWEDGCEDYEQVITFDPELTEGSYTIVIGAEMFSASDEDYNDVGVNAETTLTYTITASSDENGEGGETALELTFDPESGSTISGSLSSIKVSCAEEYYLASSSNNITIYKDGDEVTDVTAKADWEDGCEDYEQVITFDPELTEGSYTIVIGAEMFSASDEDYNDVGVNDEITLTYTITASSDESGEGEGEGNEGESAITLPNNDVVTCTFASDTDGYYATDTTHFTFTNQDSSIDSSTDEEGNLKYGSVTIDNVEYTTYYKITSADTITITTKEDNTVLTLVFGPNDDFTGEKYIYIEPSTSKQYVESQVFTYTLETAGTYKIRRGSGDYHVFYIGLDKDIATGINGVTTLRATSDDRFYNLNGQRVTTPRNGIYILNGKKVLIK